MAKRADRYSIVALLGLVALLWAPRALGTIDLRYDGGVYYILGTALAEGRGYRLLNEPGDIQAIQYPPALPAMVAAHQLVLGTNDPHVVGPWLNFSYFVMTVLYAVATYALARHYLSPAPALLVGVITVLYFNTFFLGSLLFAEIPFAVVTVAFAICGHREGKVRFAGMAALGTLAFLLRTAGTALLAAWVVEALVRQRWRSAVVRAVVLAVPLLGWQAYIDSVRSGDEYRHPAYEYQRAPYQYYNVSYAENVALVDPFAPEKGFLTAAGWASRFAENLVQMPLVLGQGMTASDSFWTKMLSAGLRRLEAEAPPEAAEQAASPWVWGCLCGISALIVAGAIVFVARRQWFIPLYLAAAVALMCLTPWPAQFTRYLTPVTPFLALAFVQLLVVVRNRSRRGWSRAWQRVGLAAAVSVAAVVLAVEAVAASTAFRSLYMREAVTWARGSDSGTRLFFHGERWFSYGESLVWLAQHGDANAVVATTCPHWAYLQTGMKAILPPMETDADKAQRLLDSVPVKYVIDDAHVFLDTSKYTRGAVERHPQLWTLVHRASDGRTTIYRRVD